MIELTPPPVSRPQSEEDWAANQKAAEADWSRLIDSDPTAADFCAYHKHWYMAAGHKRLGRLYVQYANESAN